MILDMISSELHSLLLSSCGGLQNGKLSQLTLAEMKSLVGLEISNLDIATDDLIDTISKLPLLEHLNVAYCSHVTKRAISAFLAAKPHALIFCESFKLKGQ
jgi:hypothetical protein